MSLQRLARLREGIYRFVSAGFSYPTTELLEVAAGTVPVLDDLGLFDYAFALPVVEAAQTLADTDLDDLRVAHAALFEAGVGGAACSPHATTYLADPRTGGVARMQSELRAAYRRLGFGDDLGPGDMVDHVATEIEALARLCAAEVRTRDDGGDPAHALYQQLDFLVIHLAPWIPVFTRQVAAVDRDRAYSALATALHAFVEHDRELLRALLQPIGAT
ncbi:MAG: hypothetical protein HKN44_02180 [Ilumatobacter sp.]|nr:hypothetical protein [Ilumatobacter sp.]